MIKFIKVSILSLILISCTEPPKTETTTDSALFFDVVYKTVATRETPSKAWVGVSGTMQMKITQSTEAEGTFIFFYQNYKEPQFVFNTCSGGFKGNFIIPETTAPPADSSSYDILNPYVPEVSNPSTNETTDPNVTVDQINNYNFQLSITFRSLEEQCRPENDRIIVIYRFTNGEIILKNEYRELLMKPVLTSESQIN